MKQNSRTKYDIMSQCLRLFKEVPHFLENFVDLPSQSQLMQLVKCSNKFVELANCEEAAESQLGLYQRFFCRLREIIYSYLNFYLYNNNFLFIKQLLLEVNKQIMMFKPGTGPAQILLKISTALINNLTKMAKSNSVSQKQFTEVLQAKVEYKPKIVQPQEIFYKPERKKIVENQNLSIKSKTSTEESLTKAVGYDAINDIDASCFEKICTNASSQNLLKDCLNRNKFISALMKKYEQRYKIYENKPQHRKNRNPPEYCPTQMSISPRRQINKRSPGYFKMSPSPEKRTRSLKTKPTFNNNEMFQLVIPSSPFQGSFFKEDIMNQTFAFRQKYTMTKIMIGTKELELNSPQHMNQTVKNFYKSAKPKSHRQSSRHGSQSQRMKMITNRTYFSGFMQSIPLC